MAVTTRRSTGLSPWSPSKLKSPGSIGKSSQSTRGRSKTRVTSEVKHHNASPHPTRCLRGVSTRATFKRSPSPRKDWPFDEAILYPPHQRVGSPRTKSPSLAGRRSGQSAANRRKATPGKPGGGTASSRSCQSKKSKKSPGVACISKKTSPRLSDRTREQVVHRAAKTSSKDPKACRLGTKTESIATVLDGEEEFVQSPVTSAHVGWGGNLLKSYYWSHQLSGKHVVQVSRAILWNEVHNGSSVWKPHRCINDFRLVSHSRELYNPYQGSSKLQVAEYIWQFRDLCSPTSRASDSDLPPLFELLFVKKDSLLLSVLGKLYRNPTSHESISRELFSQSLLAHHENFVRINEVIQDQACGFSVFVMEYLPFSCMSWSPETLSYHAPSVLSSKVSNRVYTHHGSKLIFSQVLKAVRFLHSKGVAGIYIMPESIKLSHSLDETYTERNGPAMTRSLLDGVQRRTNAGKIQVDSDLSASWSSARTINISNELDSDAISHVNSIIQEKRSHATCVQDDAFLFNPGPFLEDLEMFYTCESRARDDSRSERGGLKVKLASPFKGMATNNRDALFSGTFGDNSARGFHGSVPTGNKWLSPPELSGSIFNGSSSQADPRKCDIWNLGVLLHCLLAGVPPSILNRRVSLDERVPAQVRGLLSSLLSLDPLLRPSVFEIEQHM